MTEATITKPATKRPRKMAREPKVEPGSAPAPATSVEPKDPAPVPAAHKPPSKSALVLGLLQRTDGASIAELVSATGWLPHTTRAALTGLKKKGYVVASEKVDGVRRYRIGGAAA